MTDRKDRTSVYGVPLDESHSRVVLGLGDYVPADVLTMLYALGESLCGYGGGEWRTRRCDCKYMNGAGRTGEATGCAELRAAVEIIERLSGSGYARTNTTLRAKLRRVRAMARKHAAELEKEASLHE